MAAAAAAPFFVFFSSLPGSSPGGGTGGGARGEGNKNGFMFKVNASASKGTNFCFYLASSRSRFHPVLFEQVTHPPTTTHTRPSPLPPSHTQGGLIGQVSAILFCYCFLIKRKNKTMIKKGKIVFTSIVGRKKRRGNNRLKANVLPPFLLLTPLLMYTRNNIITQGGK